MKNNVKSGTDLLTAQKLCYVHTATHPACFSPFLSSTQPTIKTMFRLSDVNNTPKQIKKQKQQHASKDCWI